MRVCTSDDSVFEFDTRQVRRATSFRQPKAGRTNRTTRGLLAAAREDGLSPAGNHRGLCEASEDCILGTVASGDSRVRVPEPHLFPWRLIVRLRITGRDGRQWHGTGWIADGKTIITAGHSVYHERNLGGWASEIEVSTGHANGKKAFATITSVSFSVSEKWCHGQNPLYNIGAIHLGKAFGERVGYCTFEDDHHWHKDRTLLNVTGYRSGPDGGQLIQSHVRCEDDQSPEGKIWQSLLDPMPPGLSGAPVFLLNRNGRAQVVGISVRDGADQEIEKYRYRIIDEELRALLYRWTQFETSEEGVIAISTPTVPEEKLNSPIRVSGESSPQIIYLTGDVGRTPPAETKRAWDFSLFGNPMGSETMLLTYHDLLPGCDVPISPTSGLTESVGNAAAERFGDSAKELYDSLTEDIDKTGDNPFLFGAGSMLEWLNVALTYFFKPRKISKPAIEVSSDEQVRLTTEKKGGGGEPRGRHEIRDLLLEELEDLRKDDAEVIVLTHGFGSVILYDALIKKPETTAAIGHVIALASPLAYPTLSNRFLEEERLQHKADETKSPLPLPRSIHQWIDLSIESDPIAADSKTFTGPKDVKRYQLTRINSVSKEELKAEGSQAYLKLPLLQRYLRTLLPRSFGSPVGDFTIARNVADRMGERGVRLPILLELERHSDEQDHAREMINVMVDVCRKFANGRGEGDMFSPDSLRIDCMKRYIAADLRPRELKLVQRELRKRKVKHSHPIGGR